MQWHPCARLTLVSALVCACSREHGLGDDEGQASDSATVSDATMTSTAATESGSSATDPTDSADDTQTSATTDTADETSSGSDESDTTGDETPWDGYFPPDSVWYEDISAAVIDPDSAAIIAYLQDAGWGLGRAQIDFSLTVLEADAATPRRAFEPTGDFYVPDCDHVPVPIPEGGHLEGEAGYLCESDGDCHLIVVDRSERKLYEMWRANIEDGVFRGGCLAVWEMDRRYGPEGRGMQCTSADAAGYPIAPLLVTPEEVAAGHIGHALRFILPNATIRAGEFVSPATHATRAASGGEHAPPYGVRLRLRADFPLDTLPNEAARVVARALQRHGMLLADGGNVLFTFHDDRHQSVKWQELLGPRDLDTLEPNDFEVLAMGEAIPLTYACERTLP